MKKLLPLLAILTLAGCSTTSHVPEYACPLEGAYAGRCASVHDAHAASKGSAIVAGSNSQSVFMRSAHTLPAPAISSRLADFPEPTEQGSPIFEQPKVMRVWNAPYVDASGNLRSGEYTYFNTPGKWNYGDTRKPGSASATFEPSKPSNLGFNPNTTRAAAPAAQRASTPAGKPPAPAASVPTGANSPSGPVMSGGGSSKSDAITQPYQRLNTN